MLVQNVTACNIRVKERVPYPLPTPFDANYGAPGRTRVMVFHLALPRPWPPRAGFLCSNCHALGLYHGLRSRRVWKNCTTRPMASDVIGSVSEKSNPSARPG